MSSEQINSEMSQIDQFLQSLKMGTYDPTTTQTTTTTTNEKASSVATTTATAKMGTSGVAKAQSRSLGLQLIGQLESSSSSDSDESSSDSSEEEEEETAPVIIE